jgi:hypothetical protein
VTTTPRPSYPGPSFLAVGSYAAEATGYCHRGCEAWIRGRLVRGVDGGHNGADVVDGSEYGHTCRPDLAPVRRSQGS